MYSVEQLVKLQFLKFALRKGFGQSLSDLTISPPKRSFSIIPVERYNFTLKTWNVPASWEAYLDNLSEDYGPVTLQASFFLREGKPFVGLIFVKGHWRSKFEISSLFRLGPKAHKAGSRPLKMKEAWVWSGSDLKESSIQDLFSRVLEDFKYMESGLGI